MPVTLGKSSGLIKIWAEAVVMQIITIPNNKDGKSRRMLGAIVVALLGVFEETYLYMDSYNI